MKLKSLSDVLRCGTVAGIAVLFLFTQTGCSGEKKKSKSGNTDVSYTSPTITDTAKTTSDLVRSFPSILGDLSKTSSKTKAATKAAHLKKLQLPKLGVLGYSYFKDMKIDESKSIHAFISIRHSHSAMRDTIRFINMQDEPDLKNDTVSIFTENILLYKYVNIFLIDPDSSFIVTQVHDSVRQEIDTLQGNHWQWVITAKEKNEHARLLLKVVAEKPTGDKELFQSRTIPITIHVHTNIFRVIWIYMYDNPKTTLGILITLISFLGKWYFDKKKKNLPKS